MYKKIKTMIRLTFNTTKKHILVTLDGTILADELNIPTVKVRDGFYEVMQKEASLTDEIQIPIIRLPINNTLMCIQK